MVKHPWAWAGAICTDLLPFRCAAPHRVCCCDGLNDNNRRWLGLAWQNVDEAFTVQVNGRSKKQRARTVHSIVDPPPHFLSQTHQCGRALSAVCSCSAKFEQASGFCHPGQGGEAEAEGAPWGEHEVGSRIGCATISTGELNRWNVLAMGMKLCCDKCVCFWVCVCVCVKVRGESSKRENSPSLVSGTECEPSSY